MPTKAQEIVSQIIPDIRDNEGLLPSQFIATYWHVYKNNYEDNNNINGMVFEELIALTLIHKGISPLYLQASVAFIPNVKYDFIVYTRDIKAVSLSAKVSLRERYKQADLEAVALKNILRGAKSYLITLDEGHPLVRQKQTSDLMGLDRVVLATAPDYDEMLDEIAQLDITESISVQVVESNQIVSTENYTNRYP